jgi:hypothetical protein
LGGRLLQSRRFRILPGMKAEMRQKLVPGAKVKITQQLAARDHAWSTVVRGTVVDFSQQQTGSWYAHSKNDKLWLDRLTLRKDDGEISTLNLDDYSLIEIETAAAPAA